MEENVVREVAELVDLNWQGLGRGTLRLLRERFPGVVFIAVPASDVSEEPFRKAGRVEFHFINTADHCVSLVSDRRAAGGILLAVRE
ncbi:MAG: hypothetical protein M1313_02660 [Nitrospirae bacterium]|nr:hypothetical protein [Nitrospirota bacterium]